MSEEGACYVDMRDEGSQWADKPADARMRPGSKGMEWTNARDTSRMWGPIAGIHEILLEKSHDHSSVPGTFLWPFLE
jgi:hypothetical protein